MQKEARQCSAAPPLWFSAIFKQSTEQCHSGGTAQAAFDIDLEMKRQVEFRRLDQWQNLVDHRQH